MTSLVAPVVEQRKGLSLLQDKPELEVAPPTVFLINEHECDTFGLVSRMCPKAINMEDAKVVFTDRKIERLSDFSVVGKEQRINRIPHLSQVLLKKPLAKLLADAEVDVGVSSWCLPEDRAVLQRMEPASSDQFFIVKPNSESGGSGISIHQGLSAVLNLDADAIVQPLLSNPLLFRGRKTDFRVYVLVLNGKDGEYRTFLLKQGYARVASDVYFPVSAATLHKATTYLTNDAVNIGKRDLDDLSFPIETVVPSEHMNAFMSGVGNLVRKTVHAVMNEVHRLPSAPVLAEHTYQIMGFDVFVSDDFKHFALLEVNSKPCLGCDVNKSEFLRATNTNATFVSVMLGGNCGDDKIVDKIANALSELVVEV